MPHKYLLKEFEDLARSATDAESLMQRVSQRIHLHIPRYNWVGFYLVDKKDPSTLVLGPHAGSFTPTPKITVGHGLCGFAATMRRTIVADNVAEEPHYIQASDLVKSQIAVASGATLASLGLTQTAVPAPRGYAVQLRINMEVMDAKGLTKPTGGTLEVFDPPSGPGVRVDTFGYAGYKTSAAYDSLLAKIIVHSVAASWPDVVQKAARALREFRIEGVATNIPFIQAVLAHPDFVANRVSTGFIDTHVAALVVDFMAANTLRIGPFEKNLLPFHDAAAQQCLVKFREGIILGFRFAIFGQLLLDWLSRPLSCRLEQIEL
jgi:hypothetical protein